VSALARSRPLQADPGRRIRAQVSGFVLARQVTQAARYAVPAIAVGGLLAACLGIVVQVLGLAGGRALVIVVGLAPVLAAAVVGWLRRVPEGRIALEIDRALGLDERVTTALELASRDSQTSTRAGHDLAQRQLADAAHYLSAVRPGAVYPLRLSLRRLGLALVALGLAVAPWFVPWPAVVGNRLTPMAVSSTSRAEAARLDALARQVESQGSPDDAATRAQLAAQLRQAADALRQSGSDASQANQALRAVDQAMAAAAPNTGEDASLTLARIADALNSQQLTKPATQALDQQNPAQAASDLNQLAANLANLSTDQRQALAQALQAASQAAQGSDTNAAQQLQAAADAAKNGDSPGMQQAAQALQQLANASQAQQDVSQARSALQASRDAIASASTGNAAQAVSPAPPDGSGATNGSPANSSPDASAADANAAGQGQTSQDGQNGQGQAGNQPGDQSGGGSGSGTTGHLGSPNDLPGLAQREVMVPTDSTGEPGQLGPSSQLQTGANGTARVDYSNVLPQYRQQALQAVDNGVVPNSLKSVVKGYFDSLAQK
jgi:hypothetical protein